MTVDICATLPHLLDHVAPVARELGADLGIIYSGAGKPLHDHAATYGLTVQRGYPHGGRDACLVANAHDLGQTTSARPVIFLEHGAGQSYTGVGENHPSYSGGDNRHHVRLFLALNERTAARDRVRWPDSTVRVVGSPHVDLLRQVREHRPAPSGHGGAPVVAFCWHYDEHLVPETRSAWPHWVQAVLELSRFGQYRVIGSGHPRVWHDLERQYRRLEIEPVRDLRQVVALADLVCFDNTSAGYEAAACGIPVLVLDAPWYRRDVDHGLRFWDAIPGPVIREHDQLRPWVDLLLEDGPVAHWWAELRDQTLTGIYPRWTRGRAAELAVAAIAEVLPRALARC